MRWRDIACSRANCHGIQAADLLGRKVLMEGGRGLTLLIARMTATIQRARAVPGLSGHANDLESALLHVVSATKAAWSTGNPTHALANAVPYMQAFGHTVLAWIWLDVALASRQSKDINSIANNEGRALATRYFYHYELPKTAAWLKVVETRDMTCADFPPEAF